MTDADQSSSQPFLQRAVWDTERGEIRDGDIRYMMMRTDAFMGLFRQLPVAERGQALVALSASIFEHGGRSARSYQALGASDRHALLEVIASTAPQLGWGRWFFSSITDRGLTLTLNNSPFVHGFGQSATPVCAAVVGMLQAVGSIALGGECRVTETSCAAQSASTDSADSGDCHFSVELT